MNSNSSVKTKKKSKQGFAGRMKTMRKLLQYLTVSKTKTVIVAILFIVGTISFLEISMQLGVVVNLLTVSPSIGELYQSTLIILGFAGLAFATLFTANRMLADITQKTIYLLRKDTFNHLQGLSLNFFDRQPIGELMSRLSSDMDVISSFFQSPVSVFVLGVVMLISIFIVQLILNFTLALVSLLVIPLLIILMVFVGRVAKPTLNLAQQRMGDLNGIMEENLSGQRTITAYNRQDTVHNQFSEVSQAASGVATKGEILAMFAQPLAFMAIYFSLAVVGLVGALLVIHGATSIGTLTVFLTFSQLLIVPINSIFNNYNFFMQALSGAEKIFGLLDEQTTVKDTPNAPPLNLTTGHVKFVNVDFSYTPKRKVLKNINFEAKPGQMIGLCGPTGAGKSTIINILTRYYDIDKGTILIDEQDISKVQQDSLRSQIAVVLQEPFLFSETVMYNLRYSRETATDEECIEAAKKANCHEFIMRLPQGYQTFLVEGGANLSQGQRQLLTIARAMVTNPKMLILDEATSNVDTRTEHAIKEALNELQLGRTSFVIAHRLSTIRNADMILFINDGEIAERGTHEELMALRSVYYQLFMSQYKGKVSEIIQSFEKTSDKEK